MLPAEEEELTSWEPRQIWPNDTSSITLLPCPVPHSRHARARQLLSLEVERRHRWARQLRFAYEESPFQLFFWQTVISRAVVT